jgi:hypothetical protein
VSLALLSFENVVSGVKKDFAALGVEPLDAQKAAIAAQAVEAKKPKQPEVVAPVVQKPSAQDVELRQIARKVQTLKGWRRKLVSGKGVFNESVTLYFCFGNFLYCL